MPPEVFTEDEEMWDRLIHPMIATEPGSSTSGSSRRASPRRGSTATCGPTVASSGSATTPSMIRDEAGKPALHPGRDDRHHPDEGGAAADAAPRLPRPAHRLAEPRDVRTAPRPGARACASRRPRRRGALPRPGCVQARQRHPRARHRRRGAASDGGAPAIGRAGDRPRGPSGRGRVPGARSPICRWGRRRSTPKPRWTRSPTASPRSWRNRSGLRAGELSLQASVGLRALPGGRRRGARPASPCGRIDVRAQAGPVLARRSPLRRLA